MGSRTVLSGSVSHGKDSASKSLQMMERALLTPDELKSLPKGTFIVMKTGTHADCRELERAIEARYGLRPGGQVRIGGERI